MGNQNGSTSQYPVQAVSLVAASSTVASWFNMIPQGLEVIASIFTILWMLFELLNNEKFMSVLHAIARMFGGKNDKPDSSDPE